MVSVKVGDTVQIGTVVGVIREIDGDKILKFDILYATVGDPDDLIDMGMNTVMKRSLFEKMLKDYNSGD